MGEAKEDLQNGYPRDLLQRLTQPQKNIMEAANEQESGEIELNLGLSLGGRYGADAKASDKLVRSTSIAGLTTFLREDDGAAPPPVVYPLNRTSSLPMESEEEWRRRKELQSLRRMEAKRKRTEKQQKIIIKSGRDRNSGVDEEALLIKPPTPTTPLTSFPTNSITSPNQQHHQQLALPNGVSPSMVAPPLPFGIPCWTGSGRGSVVDSSSAGKSNALTAPPPGHGHGQGFLPPTSQASLGSHGSSSSGDSRVVQGNSVEAKSPARSPARFPPIADKIEQKPTIARPSNPITPVSIKVEVESPSKKPKTTDNVKREAGMKVMEEMPCVSTKGDGPNGRRIEGFLYKYKKGEEVRIVCVCHGSFLTPAEFVKHAGGGDVAHPLRHIVVSPSPSFL